MVTFGPTTVFGGNSAAPSSGGFSFGGTSGNANTSATASTPAAPSLFGAPSAAAPATSSTSAFGFAAPTPAATTTAAPSTTGGLFGTPNAAPSSSFFNFPAPSSNHTTANTNTNMNMNANANMAPQRAVLQAHMNATLHQEASHLESQLLRLHSSYSPYVTVTPTQPPSQLQPSSLCRFQHIFYDEITEPQRMERMALARSHATTTPSTPSIPHPLSYPPKPPHIDAETWSRALAQTPHPPGEYLPTLLSGAEALHSRVAAQQAKANLYRSHLSRLADAVQTLKESSRHGRDLIRHHSNETKRLQRRLLGLMRTVEIVRCRNIPLQDAERVALERIRSLSKQVQHVHQVLDQVSAESDEYRDLLARTVRDVGAAMNDEDDNVLEEGGFGDEVRRVLKEHREGMEALEKIVKKDTRDLNIVKHGISDSGNNSLGSSFITSGGDGSAIQSGATGSSSNAAFGIAPTIGI